MMNKFHFTLICCFMFFACSRQKAISLIDETPALPTMLTSSNVETIDCYQDARTILFISAVYSKLNNVSYKIDTKPYANLTMINSGICQIAVDGLPLRPHELFVKIYSATTFLKIQPFYLQYKNINNQIVFCDPKIGLLSGDGSFERPFPSLEKLLKSGYLPQKNQTIFLLTGNHGDIQLSGASYQILAFKGAKPLINSVEIISASNLILHGLTICARKPNKQNIISIDSSSTNIKISNCKIGCLLSDDELVSKNWRDFVTNGIHSKGNQISISNNLIQYAYHGVQMDGDSCSLSNNIIDRFCGDAIRNTGNSNTYVNNFITNALIDDYYEVDGNHDDMFQAWTHDKPIKDIKIINNVAISILDTNIQSRSKIVQGIVCFDGFSENWEIRDNTVYTDHPHGISLYGAKGCNISKNMVIRHPMRLATFESDPWIMVNDHKDKRKSSKNVVQGNKSAAYRILADDTVINNNVILDSITTQYLYKIHGWQN